MNNETNIDVSGLMAINADLNARMAGIHLQYGEELSQFKASLQAEFRTAMETNQANAQAENQRLRDELARLHKSAAVQPDAEMSEATNQQRTRDPRTRPTTTSTPTKDPRTRPLASPSPGVRTRPTAMPENQPQPAPRASPNPPRSSSSRNSPLRSSPHPRSSPNPPSTPSTPSSQTKKATKSTRKPAEHQMLKTETAPEAQKFKTAFGYHIRFVWGCLNSKSVPTSATFDIVNTFQHRFQGLTVADLRRTGQMGPNLIDPANIKLGVTLEQSIRSKSRIITAFFKLEESALLHVRAYLAKLGITTWAPDFSQSAYSLYNMAMRMCIIDTFRYLVAGTFYDFLRPNTRLVNDTVLLSRLYDHFVHYYMFDKFKAEIRTPGGNEIAAERNTAAQTRRRLHKSRQQYIQDSAAPQGLRLMFSLKATSDDEATPTGSRVLARPERSQDADIVLRTVDSLIIDDLLTRGKKRAANNRERRVAPAFGQRNLSRFREIPREMPIQYYDPTWFNNRPPQMRAKIAPKHIVAFVPGSSDFFSRNSDNKLSVSVLTEIYGNEVFEKYDLDYGSDEGDQEEPAVGGSAQGASEDDGESVGSEDSDDEQSVGGNDSVGSFLTDDEYIDGEAEADFDGNGEYEAGDGDYDVGDENHMADFAAEYGVPMEGLDVQTQTLEEEIFGLDDDMD
ncbi:hypothetical protein C8J56DRAFT_1165625 [Mycena floridula]|nr:hypothetical protein C8J56DRAFT_1165625 [Mycena floridula]